MRSIWIGALLAALSTGASAADDILFERGTAAAWSSANPVLLEGEPGYDSTNDQLRIGDGVSTWSALPAFVPHPSITLGGSYDYITLSGQQVVRGQVDLSTDVTGALPWAAISGEPTTLSGYGILDALSAGTDAAVLGSGTSDLGDVLMSDGAGGTAWQAPGTLTESDPVASAALAALDIPAEALAGIYVSAPASPTSTCTQGTRAWSSPYLYDCIATNTWVRSAPERTW